ncbi:MAG: NUDIX domain-containing protein [Halieaceae bacterium]|nr:NUDIX domain-containing protein [Halieaceae bacterium]MCP5148035.1 NUDIX domain-containing protein [Pseudomonadales bacterium]MCP5167077.1 NUDIX domain-containing protein [Pseudomonadales bacterium]MCP5188481.1 NUDIX domain-containing protein [Pseudomonadales bacterium]
MSLELTFGARDVRVLEDVAAFSGHFSVRRLTLQHRCFGGGWSEPLVREVFNRGDAVGVLPYDPVTDSVVLVEQFRAGAIRGQDSPWMLELVAGVVEAGERDESVAHREAMEEAGCEMSELLPIATVLPSAGACNEQVRLFCGRVSRASVGGIHGLAAEGEDILVHGVPRLEALELLARDRVPNGHTLIALQWLQIHGAELRRRWS